jgi:FMN phosphatase YigB (HAD superfamily)
MMSKHICFDIGSVLFYVDFEPLQTYLASEYNITPDTTYQFLTHNQKLCDLGITTIHDELIHYFDIHHENKYLPGAQLAWLECICPSPEMLDLLDDLKKDGWKIALLSNMGHEHKREMDIQDAFGDCLKILSCDMGARKPTNIFYKTFLDMHPEFHNAPYIDDIQENLTAGQSFGLKPIKFELPANGTPDTGKLLTEIQNTLLG